MGRNFYYGSDARIVAGSARFASLISQSPEAYGIPEPVAAEYVSLDAQLQIAHRAATTPTTRTPVAVREKDELLSQVRRAASKLAQVAYATAGVSDAQLLELGLLPRAVRRPRVLPAEAPVVEVVSVRGRVVSVRIHARSGDEGRKPLAALGAEIYTHVGEDSPSDPRAYHFRGVATRATTEIRFDDDVPSGATAWISAAWISSRGKRGIACNPVPVTITGGAVAAAG